MKSAFWFSFIDRINLKVFFLLLFAYQVLFTFQGLDLSDEGFVGTFYQQIFSNPESVQYNFMFWLSGIVGGVFNYFFGESGIWGLRVFSAILTTASIILVYRLLKPYLNATHLKIGLVVVTLFLSNNTKVFHYNYLSVLFYILTISFLFKGLRENGWLYFFIAGVFVAMDTLTRIPSIVNMGLVIAIFYYGYKNKTVFSRQFKQSLFFIAGFAAGILLMLVVMKLIGHFDIFINALKLVVQMGGSADEGHYGLLKLIQQFLGSYSASLKYAFIILSFLLLVAVGVDYYRTGPYYKKWILEIFKYLLILFVAFLTVAKIIDHKMLLYFLTGTSLMAGFLILMSDGNTELKTLMLMGCYILLAYPFGSSAGLITVGIYSLWIAFPIASDYFLNIRKADVSVNILESNTQFKAKLLAEGIRWNAVKRYTTILCISACLYYAWYYPFFDYHERTDMRYSVNSKYLRGIYTTRGRADIINELINESSKYIKPGDYVLAYHSMPLFNYITRTVPYVRNSMPWFYNTSVFNAELNLAYERTGVLPVIIRQKRKTFGKSGSAWPDPEPFYDAIWYKRNAPRDSCMNIFLEKNNYNKVWENQVFEILTPAAAAAK